MEISETDQIAEEPGEMSAAQRHQLLCAHQTLRRAIGLAELSREHALGYMPRLGPPSLSHQTDLIDRLDFLLSGTTALLNKLCRELEYFEVLEYVEDPPAAEP